MNSGIGGEKKKKKKKKGKGKMSGILSVVTHFWVPTNKKNI